MVHKHLSQAIYHHLSAIPESCDDSGVVLIRSIKLRLEILKIKLVFLPHFLSKLELLSLSVVMGSSIPTEMIYFS